MNNKLNNMINEFLANVDAKDEEQLNKALQEFIQKYNDGEIEYENTPLDDAYEILEKAQNAKSKTQAMKYAKQAYDKCNDCLDALLFQVQLEDDYFKKWDLINKGLEFEKSRLEKENYFRKDNIGHFYGIFETRPYIKGLYIKAKELLVDGKIKQARKLCKEILKLNENDNTGARYLLMAIYAYLEEEKDILKLYKKYPEEALEMLFPLFAFYYKVGNEDKAIEYLNRINKANPHFVKYFDDTIEINDDIPDGHFSIGDSSEVIMYFDEYAFLTDTMTNIEYFILEHSKNKK